MVKKVTVLLKTTELHNTYVKSYNIEVLARDALNSIINNLDYYFSFIQQL